MTKKIRDEFVEHHEGQAIFTAQRVTFGVVVVAALVALGFWIGFSGGSE